MQIIGLEGEDTGANKMQKIGHFWPKKSKISKNGQNLTQNHSETLQIIGMHRLA